MLVKSVSLASLTPDPSNARRHGERNIDAIRHSLLTFGQVEPLVVNTRTGQIVGGHGRVEAMRALGWTEAKVVEVDLEPQRATALGLALNRTAELAEWDDSTLAKLLGDLRVDPALFEVTGFSEADLEELLVAPAGDPDERDVVLIVPDNPITRAGDVWTMGKHRLICGDARDPDVVAAAFGDLSRATCIVTDPPYGVDIAGKNRLLNSVQKSGRNLTEITDDDLVPEELKAKLLPAFRNIRNRASADDCCIFVTAPQGGELGMMMMMHEAGLTPRHVLIWRKNAPTFSMGRLDYDYAHEPILMTWGKRHKRVMAGEHRTSVWEIAKPRASEQHPTMKPVELYRNAYLNHSEAGDVVFDAYAGSGTCFIAAEETRRRAVGVELSPNWCDSIVRRWQTFTGGQAVRQDGVPFSVLAPAQPVEASAS